MVFIITGAAEAGRNTVGRLLAEALGWEFVEAENLCLARDFGKCSSSKPDLTLRIEALPSAITIWIYEWRDVVVSCPTLTEEDRRQLSKISSLVKIVYLEASHSTGRTPLVDRAPRVANSEFLSGAHATRGPERSLLTLDSSRHVEELIAEMTAALMM
jgi:gluconokinase